MFEQIFIFFYNTIFMGADAPVLSDMSVTIFNEYTFSLSEYLAFICSLVSIIIIVVLCCLFVYKLVRIVSGLITHR